MKRTPREYEGNTKTTPEHMPIPCLASRFARAATSLFSRSRRRISRLSISPEGATIFEEESEVRAFSHRRKDSTTAIKRKPNMKSIVLGSTLVLIAFNLFGQGTIVFTSHTTDRDSHIWGPSSTNPSLSLLGPGSNDRPSGSVPYQADGMALIGATGANGPSGYSTTFAQLLVAAGASQPEVSLVPMSPTTTFHSGAAAGQIVAVTVPLTGVPAGTTILTLEGVAWDNSSGLYPTWTQAFQAWTFGLIAAGKSMPANIDLALGNTYVHDSFNLYFIPEPSVFALAGLGAAALMICRRRK
jgi:PEP-CTERM motif